MDRFPELEGVSSAIVETGGFTAAGPSRTGYCHSRQSAKAIGTLENRLGRPHLHPQPAAPETSP